MSGINFLQNSEEWNSDMCEDDTPQKNAGDLEFLQIFFIFENLRSQKTQILGNFNYLKKLNLFISCYDKYYF